MACSRHLKVAIMHAQHICSQHSFRLPLRMNGTYRTQSDLARFGPSIAHNMIVNVLTMYEFDMKLRESTALEKDFLPSIVLACSPSSLVTTIPYHVDGSVCRQHHVS